MRPMRLVSAVAALAVLAAPLVTPASAGQNNSAPMHRHIGSGIGGFPPIGSPSVSTALSTALSVDGVGPGVNANQFIPGSLGGGKKAFAPSVQVGVGAAVAIDGNASARALNSIGDGQGNGR